jgi:translocator protein
MDLPVHAQSNRGPCVRRWGLRAFLGLLVFMGASLLTGYAGSLVTASSVSTWYPALRKPDWTPADAVFPVVWTTLFLLMGLAAWRVWRRAGWSEARAALTLFFLQLVLNFIWSALFFGLRSPGAGLAEILVLIGAIVATMVAFSRHDAWAGRLMAPYLVWTSFAAVLNLTIWRMN